MTALAPFALNAFVPSIPRLVEYFRTDLPTAQLSLTLFLVGLAAGQLVYGPISDRYGRRLPLLSGLALAMLASIFCLLAASAEWLNLARIVQALGLCAGTVLGRAIVRDCHGRDRSASMLGYVTMAMAVVPALAPSIGGWLDLLFGWRASFAAMLLFTAVIFFWCLRSAHETNRQPLRGIGPVAMWQSYTTLLRARSYVAYCGSVTLSSAAFFAFLAGAPYLMLAVLDLSPLAFGLCFVAVSVSYMLGNFITGRLSTRLGVDRLMLLGLLLALPSCLGMLAAAWLYGPHPLTIFIPMCGMAMGNGMSQPTGIAGAISVKPQLAGAASGLLGFVQMAGSAAATLLMGYLQNDTLYPLAGVMSACVGGSLAFYTLGRRRPNL